MNRRVYIVIVNWNGWKDTIECLESVLRLNYEDFKIVVCDNASADNSAEKIRDWSIGRLAAGVNNPELAHLSNPPVAKPVIVRELILDAATEDNGSNREQVTLIHTGANLGFAGGCNVGMQFALQDGECRYVWLLNNDTVVDPEALSRLVATSAHDSSVGMCGSLCVYYREPDRVQAPGGMPINTWTGRVDPPHGLRRAGVAEYVRTKRIDYLNGASMLITRECLESVGFLNEQYFLYFEEIDITLRAAGRYTITYDLGSIVYHKQGASAGTASARKDRSVMAERFGVRSRVLLARRFFPARLPVYVLAILAAVCHRAIVGPRRNALVMFAAVWSGLRAPLEPMPKFKPRKISAEASQAIAPHADALAEVMETSNV